jgi:hypothetical protein
MSITTPLDVSSILQPLQTLLFGNLSQFIISVNQPSLTVTMSEPVAVLAALGCVNVTSMVLASGDINKDMVHQIATMVCPGNTMQQQMVQTLLYSLISGAGVVITKELVSAVIPKSTPAAIATSDAAAAAAAAAAVTAASNAATAASTAASTAAAAAAAVTAASNAATAATAATAASNAATAATAAAAASTTTGTTSS